MLRYLFPRVPCLGWSLIALLHLHLLTSTLSWDMNHFESWKWSCCCEKMGVAQHSAMDLTSWPSTHLILLPQTETPFFSNCFCYRIKEMAARAWWENPPNVPSIANAQKDGFCVCSCKQSFLPLVEEMPDTPSMESSKFIVSTEKKKKKKLPAETCPLGKIW